MDEETASFKSRQPSAGRYVISQNRTMQFVQDLNNKRTGHGKICLPKLHKAGNHKVRALQKVRGALRLRQLRI